MVAMATDDAKVERFMAMAEEFKAKERIRWATECARESLPIFIHHVPEDDTLVRAIGTIERWLADPQDIDQAALVEMRTRTHAAATAAYLASGPNHANVAYGAFEAAEAVYCALVATLSFTSGLDCHLSDATFWAEMSERRAHYALRRMAGGWALGV